MIRKLRDRQMPPAGMPRPEPAAYQAFIDFIEKGRDRLAETKPNPGRTTLHRLNRTEYANTIRDLLAVSVDVSELLPADDIGYGFDNIGDVLTVSPFLLERYLAAAGKISRLALGDTKVPATYQTYTLRPGLNQRDRMSDDMPLGSRGGTAVSHLFPVDGEYEITITLQRGRFDEYIGMGRDRQLDLRIDDERAELFMIKADPRAARGEYGAGNVPDAHLKIRVPVKAGTHELVATFLKDTIQPEGIIRRGRVDTSFYEGLGTISVGGRYNVKVAGERPSREKSFTCRPVA